MCTGGEIALIAAAVSAAGTAKNQQQQNKNEQSKINARNAEALREQQRQKDIQARNDVTVGKTVADFGAENQQQSFGDMLAKREQAYADNAPGAGQYAGASVSESTPQVVKTDLAKKVAGRMAESKASAKALARIGAGGDVFQNNGLGINQAGNFIGTQNNLARGSLETNRVEQAAAANNAGNKRSTFGDLLSAAGAAGSIYAGTPGAGNGGVPVDGAGGPLTQAGPFDNSLPYRNQPIPGAPMAGQTKFLGLF